MLLLSCAAPLLLLFTLLGAHALPPHPRLILTPQRLLDVKGFIANNTQAAAYHAKLVEQGEFVLRTAPLPRPPANATDILSASRTVLTRTYVTSLLYALTRNDTYAARATAEMLSYTSWADWDIGKHALDTGELSHAAAIGLDWCYEYLATRPASLAAIVSGIVTKSGLPFKAAYEARTWWTCDPSNWAQVTSGGAALAALALEGEDGVPAWYGDLLVNATAGVLCSARAAVEYGGGYAPGGGWWEGPIYHGYALRYFVPFASALSTAHGDDSLFSVPGLLRAPMFQMAQMDNAFFYFNWADSSTGQETLAMLLAVAQRGVEAGDSTSRAAAYTLRSRLDQTNISTEDIDRGAQTCMEYPHALMYFTAAGGVADRAAQPTDHAFPTKMVALMRTSWVDSNATFVGVKGCNCSHNHGDLDHGTFVVSTLGERFICDLGADSYSLPAYFGNLRYSYYRKNTRGANTLSFNNLLATTSDCGGMAPHHSLPSTSSTFLDAFSSLSGSAVEPAPPGHPVAACPLGPGEQACAIIDLTPAYRALEAGGLSSVSRRVALNSAAAGGSVRVEDTWRAGSTGLVNITASFHTETAVQIASDGLSATLTAPSGVSARLSLLPGGCARAVLSSVSVRLAPPQDPTPHLHRIDAFTTASAGCGGWAFELTPLP